MYGIIVSLHVVVCVILIMIVLLQTGKGAEMGAAFGGSTQTIFGSTGPASFLNKLTTAIAVLFMVTSLILCYFSGRVSLPTIMEGKGEKTEQAVPPSSSQPLPGEPTTPPAQEGAPVPGELAE